MSRKRTTRSARPSLPWVSWSFALVVLLVTAGAVSYRASRVRAWFVYRSVSAASSQEELDRLARRLANVDESDLVYFAERLGRDEPKQTVMLLRSVGNLMITACGSSGSETRKGPTIRFPPRLVVTPGAYVLCRALKERNKISVPPRLVEELLRHRWGSELLAGFSSPRAENSSLEEKAGRWRFDVELQLTNYWW